MRRPLKYISLIYQLLLLLFFVATAIQLFYWLALFSRLAFYRGTSLVDEGEKRGNAVSVIICAHNEAENLKKNLPLFLNQNYHSYEVLVVNDNSSDDTERILLDFQLKYPNLRLVDVSFNSLPGKKAALQRGIEAAYHEILLLTDADCSPSNPHWLYYMQSVIRGDTEIGLGYSSYHSKKGFLNKLIRFETVYTAVQYLSFALAGLPYMGVGRNLIYKKSLFNRVGGFKRHIQYASGDDDLFINEAANNKNTAVILRPETFVFSRPKTTLRDYYRQKSRHFTTGIAYKSKHKLMLGLLSASHLFHYLCLFGLLWQYQIVIGLYLVRICIVFFMYALILKKFQDKTLIPWIVLFDVVYILYYLIFAPVLLIGNKKTWK